MAYPDREDLYRLRIDLERYDAAKPMGRLRSLAAALLERARVRLDEIGRFLVPNLSEADQEAFAAAFGVDPARVVRGNVAKYGHVFASDFVVNYITATEELPFGAGPLLLCSHGFGFTTGAALLSRGSEARSK
jgi:3-oxoacyl-[acyl-carrier-protein] synthase III